MKTSNVSCPAPREPETIQLAHGGGGRRMRRLIDEVFLRAFAGAPREPLHDSALVALAADSVAFTTDSYVVSPLFFPGGDIGTLAFYGTVNDLAAAAARPICLSAAFILEEGLPLATLERVVASMQRAAERAGVRIVTGDTKVVDRGKGDGVFITTSGVGVVYAKAAMSPARVADADAILLSGDIGRHGAAILTARNDFALDSPIESDCAPLAELAEVACTHGDVHCMRDVTRGGLATVLNEIALDAGVGVVVEESAIPTSEPVQGVCELLGLDPLYLANEGTIVCVVPQARAEAALGALRSQAEGRDAAAIGRVLEAGPRNGRVVLHTTFGGQRIVDMLVGDQLPRIC